MFLLDTVTVSELRKGHDRADPGVVAWDAGVPATLTYISVVTIRELRTGALLVARRDADGGTALNRWVDGVVRAWDARLLPIGTEVAEACAALHVPSPRPAEDAWIAATAHVQGLTVVTRNVRDFADFDVPTLNPWSA